MKINIATPHRTKYIIDKYNLFAKKNYGQNFIINPSIIENIIELSDISKDDYVIENINTQLVEVIDLPVIDENRNITEMYDEYEFYWDNSATLTNAEGKYILNTMIMGDRLYKGLIPGNFIVRFIYGDNDAIIRDKDGNEIAIIDILKSPKTDFLEEIFQK